MAIRLVTYEKSGQIPQLPGNNMFHSVELFRILEKTPSYWPVMLVAYEGDTPVGKMLCVIRQLSWLTGLNKKCVVYGTGEYFNSDIDKKDDKDRRPDIIFGEFLEYFTRKYDTSLILIEFRNLEESLFGYRYFRQNGYFPVKWLRVINSIHHTNYIDKWMSKSRKRQINQGLKLGLNLDFARNDEDVKAFFIMLKSYYTTKIYRYLPDLNFFLMLMEESNKGNDMGKIFTVSYKGKMIGGSVCFFSGDTAYLMFSGGMRKRYPRLYPCVLAIWNAMEYSRKMGYRHFEFMDAGLPFKKYSYRDFILRFGGKQITTRRWYRIRWKWVNKILEKLYV